MIARTTPASWQALDHTGADRPRPPAFRRLLVALGLLALLTTALTGCGSNDDSGTTADTATAGTIETTGTDDSAEAATFSGTLRIGAIPDQDPDVLQRQFGLVSDHLADQLGVDVEYVPVTDYQGAVSGFAVGDLDLVWFGGLTGVQARLEVDGARAIVQRDIDAEFTSVFITGADTGIEPISDVAGLSAVAGHSFTFGSESSTSGRLMPQYFLSQAGIDVGADLTGEAGFSGSHDATIEVVKAGTYEVGALNSQVWDSRVAEGAVDTSQVIEVFRTPPYYDYHWVAQPDLDDRFGAGFTDAVVAAFTGLDGTDPGDAEILDLFGAGGFVPTENGNYQAIETVARDIGAIR